MATRALRIHSAPQGWLLLALLMLLIAAGGTAAFFATRADHAKGLLQQAQQQLGELQDQIDKLQMRLDAADVQLQQASQPDLPVTVAFVSEPDSDQFSADFRSYSISSLPVIVTVTDVGASHPHQRRFRILLAPGASRHVGKDDGWELRAGELLELSSSGFRPLERIAGNPH